MKKSLSILFVLFFLPANLFAADTLEKLLKKWTYHHVIGCGKAYLTYVSDDIVDAWMDEENSKEMLDRIGKLKQTIKDEKIRLYLLKVIKMNRSDFHIDFSDFEKRIYMQITEADDNKYFPAAISRNLSGELRHPQTYITALSLSKAWRTIILFKPSHLNTVGLGKIAKEASRRM